MDFLRYALRKIALPGSADKHVQRPGAEFRGQSVSLGTPAPKAVMKRHAQKHCEDEEDDLRRTAGERCYRERCDGGAGAETTEPPAETEKR